MVLAGGWPANGRRLVSGWLVSSSKRCHFPAILRGMHDDENDDGHKGYDPWGHLAATAGLPGLVLQLVCLAAGVVLVAALARPASWR